MGLQTNTFSTWKAREQLNEKPIIAFCDRHGYDLNYVLLGKQQKASEEVAEPTTSYVNLQILPLIPIDAMAGTGAGDDFSGLQITEKYIVPEFNKRADFLIRISGTSMSPKYFNGDIVACKKIPTKTFLQWGKVYVMDTIQGVICKRVLPSQIKNHIVCRSDNSEMYPDFEIPWSEVRSLAIVVGSIRLE